MTLSNYLRPLVRTLDPGLFALVMATGIVSIGVGEHGMPTVARALFAVNVVAYVVLVVLTALRIAWARDALVTDFTNPARDAAFLTFIAGTCVLAGQCLLVVHLPAVAIALAIVGAVSWAVLVYLLLLVVITEQHKPTFGQTINGRWLIVVVSTQSVAMLITLLVVDHELRMTGEWLFVALCLYLVGAALYLILITLIFHRLLFLPLPAKWFTPPYWIDMGALAITALAGNLIVLHSASVRSLQDLIPFVKGFSLFFWATATWWIPLLTILEIWRHGMRHVRLHYETADWDMVFPLGMYAVSTSALATVLDMDSLRILATIGAYVSVAVWVLIAGAGLRAWYRRAGLRTIGR